MTVIVETEPFKREVVKNDPAKRVVASLAKLGLHAAVLNGVMLPCPIENATVEATHVNLCSHSNTVVMIGRMISLACSQVRASVKHETAGGGPGPPGRLGSRVG